MVRMQKEIVRNKAAFRGKNWNRAIVTRAVAVRVGRTMNKRSMDWCCGQSRLVEVWLSGMGGWL